MFKSRTCFALILAVLVAVLAIAPDAEAKKRTRGKRAPVSTASGINDPRYAALIMNPATGEIYHQHDADQRRYPASLTKMMTLYMLFDALEQKKIDLDDRMSVSDYASTMPQTNLSLNPGDRIPVETAIKALVVRSANDVSVVVAEALAGDVDNFAEKMTAQARKLGMRSTVFKNPNGLPNSGQVTTARDMAKLGIALKRDFPKYYHYFSTLQFSHDGVTYYTHNRVMLRYAGVDGIKTGYIGASGFNLVTSVSRGGRPLVGVVLGGTSGKWRDNRMIQLLDQTYAVVASRGAARGKMYPANLPLSKNGTQKSVGVTEEQDPNAPQVALNTAAIPESGEAEDGGEGALPPAELPTSREEIRQAGGSPFAVVEDANVPPKQEQAVTVTTPKTATATASRSRVIQVKEELASGAAADKAAEVAPAASAPETMVADAVPTTRLRSVTPPPDLGWGIQVGAFSTHELAEQAAITAARTAGKPLVGSRLAIMGPNNSGVPVHRARLENLSQAQAKKACEILINNHSPCFIFKTAP